MPTALRPPCDELHATDPWQGHDAPAPGVDGAQPFHETGTMVATVFGSSLAFVVGSIVNVALPPMRAEIGTDAAGAQWIVNAYLLPLGALVLIGGALGDHYGRNGQLGNSDNSVP